MIATGMRDDSSPKLLIVERNDGVVCAAELKGPNPLKILALEK